MKDFWNERFSQKEYIYGELPNEYLKDKIHMLKPGKALFPAEGEGRNAVYTATLGWEVTAFDSSDAGKTKALQLAQKNHVTIRYELTDFEQADFQAESFDLLVLIYTHQPENKRKEYHRKLAQYIRPGGHLILEGFSKAHIKNQQENPQAGGPGDISMLYDLSELKEDFKGFEWIETLQTETILSEGNYHKGKADVVRIFATKK